MIEFEINEAHPSVVRLTAIADGQTVLRLVADLSEVRKYLPADSIMEDDVELEFIGTYHAGNTYEPEYMDVDHLYLIDENNDQGEELHEITDWYYQSAWQVRAHLELQVLNEIARQADRTWELYAYHGDD